MHQTNGRNAAGADDSKLVGKTIASVVALICGSLFAMGCPVSNSPEQKLFTKSPTPTASISVSASGTTIFSDGRDWQTPVNIDAAAVTAPSPAATPYDTANSSTGLGSSGNYPVHLAGIFDVYGRPFVGMTMKELAPFGTALYQPVVAYPQSYTFDSWHSSTSFETFHQLGSGLDYETAGGVAPYITPWMDFIESSDGGIHYFFARRTETTTGSGRHIYWSSRSSSSAVSDPWPDSVAPSPLTAPLAATELSANGIDLMTCTPRLSADADGGVVMMFCATDNGDSTPVRGPYASIYSPSLGWASPVSVAASFNYFGTTYSDPTHQGIDLSINENGDGWAVYLMMNDNNDGFCDLGPPAEKRAVVVRQYTNGSGFTGLILPAHTADCADVSDYFAYPRIWTRSDGSFTLFYYQYLATAPADTSLYRVDGDASGAMSSPVRIDDSNILSSLRLNFTGGLVGSQMTAPGLAYYGDNAVVTWVENDTTTGVPRLYASFYTSSTGSWSAATAIDESLSNGVGWTSVSAGAAYGYPDYAQFLFAYEGDPTTPVSVHARIYDTHVGAYTAETTIATPLDTNADARPRAITGPQGQAAVLFYSTTSAPAYRRAYISTFR